MFPVNCFYLRINHLCICIKNRAVSVTWSAEATSLLFDLTRFVSSYWRQCGTAQAWSLQLWIHRLPGELCHREKSLSAFSYFAGVSFLQNAFQFSWWISVGSKWMNERMCAAASASLHEVLFFCFDRNPGAAKFLFWFNTSSKNLKDSELRSSGQFHSLRWVIIVKDLGCLDWSKHQEVSCHQYSLTEWIIS